MRTHVLRLSAYLLLALVAAAACGAAARRVIAIGDLHGDIENAREVLRLAQVTDDDGSWAAGADTVIQMGDVVDRGPHGHTIMELLERLKAEAAAAGGELITLLGNHELMNYQGDAKFVVPAHVSALGGQDAWRDAFTSSDHKYGALIADRPTAVIRNGTVFVHAGITKEVAALGTVEQLNEKMHDLLVRRAFADPLLLAEGPVWTRRLIYGAQSGNCDETYAALQEMNRVERAAHGENARPIRRMVVGHTIQPNGAMRMFCNGTLAAIDIAISQYMINGGHLGHLELRPTPPAVLAETGVPEVPWFYYPSRPNARHTLHLPERPAFDVVSNTTGTTGGGLTGASRSAAKSGLRRVNRAMDRAVDGAVDAVGSWSHDHLGTSRWRPHRAMRYEEHFQAIVLGGVAVLVLLWRVLHNCRVHRERAAGKKTDRPV